MEIRKYPKKRITYVILLFIFSMGAFGLASDFQSSTFLKLYGLILLLQGGFALVYLGLYRRRRQRTMNNEQ